MTKKWTFDPFESYRGSHRWLPERTIFIAVHGSQAYGTSTPESDIDIKGLAIPPKEYFLGLTKTFEQAESNEPYDMVIYELRKFMKLAAECNPNIIEILFTDPEDWVIETSLFRKLWEQRHLFLSKKARFTFAGYANQQLKRIKGHKRWLMEPPSHKPTREEFGLPTERKMSASDLGATQKLVNEKVFLNEDVMRLFNLEQRYQSANREWEQYQKWKITRNPKRAKIEAEYGFDLKHAMHLVRLLKMCREILEEGRVYVRRPDAEELLAIRHGAWTYEQLIEWADKQDSEMNTLYKQSKLPDKAKLVDIDALCLDLVEEALKYDSLRF